MFAIVSLVVIGLIVVYHAQGRPGISCTIALGSCSAAPSATWSTGCGSGSVVDWVDMGIGTQRF